MSDETSEGRERRVGLIVGAAALLLVLAALVLAALWLPRGSLELLAAGLDGSRERVATSFDSEVDEALRAEVLAEMEAQASWLRGLAPLELAPDEARFAARPAESLGEWLSDERLDPEECRRFLSLGRRTRSSLP